MKKSSARIAYEEDYRTARQLHGIVNPAPNYQKARDNANRSYFIRENCADDLICDRRDVREFLSRTGKIELAIKWRKEHKAQGRFMVRSSVFK